MLLHLPGALRRLPAVLVGGLPAALPALWGSAPAHAVCLRRPILVPEADMLLHQKGRICERMLARTRSLVLIVFLSVLPSQLVAGPGGDGHSHGDEPAPATGAASPRVSMRGETYDLVAILEHRRLTFYLDRLRDNEPVADATLEVTIGQDTTQLRAGADATYQMDGGRVAEAGSHELVVSLTGPGGDDLLVGTLVVPSSASPVAHPATHLDDRLRSLWQQISRGSFPDRPLFLAFGAGACVGLLGALLARRGRRAAAPLAVLLLLLSGKPGTAGPGGDGHSHGDEAAGPIASDAPHRLPDGSLFVPKPTQRLLEIRTVRTEEREVRRTATIPGRIIADPHRSGLVQSINGGRLSTLAGERLPQLGQRVAKGDLLALVEPPVNAADETTIGDKSGEIAQQITLAEVRLRRLASLAVSNVIPRTQVTDLETELQALKERRAALRSQRRQAEELRAPVGGEIAATRAVAGQVVAPQDPIFQVLDPASMWVEAFAFGDLDSSQISRAVAIIHGGRSLDLRFEGVGRVLQAHAAHLQFSIEAPPKGLMVGQSVSVLVETDQTAKGIALPRTAVVRAGNGDTVVWHHAGSERFVPKPVRGELVNGDTFVVFAGLEPGVSVVAKGAELINQVR